MLTDYFSALSRLLGLLDILLTNQFTDNQVMDWSTRGLVNSTTANF